MPIKTSSRISNVKTYYFATKLAEIRKIESHGIDVINLGIGSPDLQPPKNVIETLIAKAKLKDANKYQSYSGIPELRNAFASWYKQHFGVDLHPGKEILPLLGSKEGIMHISMSYLNEGDIVLAPNPGYPTYAACAKLAGAEVKYYNLKEEQNWLPNFEELKSLDSNKIKLMWVNYPHMPSGAVGSLENFQRLVEFATESNILLCHDNPYSFILNPKPISIFSVEGAKDIAVELTSLSKTYHMAGWRVGAVCGAENFISSILRFKSNMDSGMYKPIQEAAIEALGQDESWFHFINTEYKKRRRIAYRILDTFKCSYSDQSTGMFVWARLPAHITSSIQFVDEILKSAHVFITPGSVFGSNGDRYIRIALCSDCDLLTKALNRINVFVENNELFESDVDKIQSL